MKVLIPIIIGLLVVGYGKKQSTNTNESNNTPEKPAKKKAEKETTSKELTLRERVVGTYEAKEDGITHRAVFLDNGIFEAYTNGKKEEKEGKWSISEEGEIHIAHEYGNIYVFSIDKDGIITGIARINKDGERQEAFKDEFPTYKKIK